MSEHSFACPSCGEMISCDSSYIGRKAECPYCQQKFLVPDNSGNDRAEKKHKNRSFKILLWTIGILCLLVVSLMGAVAWLILDKKVEHPTNETKQTIKDTNPITNQVDKIEVTPIKEKVRIVERDAHETVSDALKKCVTITCIGGVGSGFFVMHDGKLKIITCRHVVEDEPLVSIKDINGNEYKVAKILVSKKRDVAVIELTACDIDKSYFRLSQDVGAVDINTRLACFGDSEGTGVIVPCYGKLLGIGPTSVETDTPFVPGNSGGPVVATNSHEVIGVASVLTRLSEGSKWVKGTRFEKQTRHFAVRIDNLAWHQLTETTYGLVVDGDYEKLVQEAAAAMKDGKVDKAIAIYTYCAEKDYSIALNELGKILFVVNRAKGGSDYKDALELFRKAAEKGSNDAKTYLGLCYKFGIGVRKDVEKAFKLFSEASKSNDYAKYQCGVCCRDGIGTTTDLQKAIKWFYACVEKSEPHGMNDLGDMYWDGIGIEKDRRKAYNLFKMAAAADYPEAQCNIGVCYQSGEGVKQDRIVAAKWFEKAAEQGLARAQDCLGDCYLSGDGVKKDYSAAVYWYHKGADQGEAGCYYSLSDCYENGNGVPRDIKKAYEYAKKAAELGLVKAQRQMGYFLSEAKGFPHHAEEAVFWYEKAARNGDAYSQNRLGLIYDGTIQIGIAKDEDAAWKWYSKSAEQGYAPAQYNIGMWYYNLDQRKTAYKWFKKSADNGYEAAKEMLK